MNLTQRGWSFFGAFLCYQLLVTALYFQYVDGLEPCPLCIFQRVVVAGLGVILLLNAIHNPKRESIWTKIYNIIGIIISLIGVGISGRHVYLQNLPESEVPACGAPLELLMDMLPFSEVLNTVLSGAGECAKISWRLWGLSMPTWMLIIFIVAVVVLSVRVIQSFKAPKQF